MAVDGFKVFDADLHMYEPVDLWPRYIDPKYRDRAPVGGATLGPFTEVFLDIDGKYLRPAERYVDMWVEQFTESATRHGRYDKFVEFEQRGWGPDTQLEAMDTEGIDVAVLYPSRGLLANAVEYDDDDLADAIGRAYNDWLADFCALAPDRMYGAAMAMPQNIEATVAEVKRASRELGFKAIYIRPNPVRGRNWHAPEYDPLWKVCEDEGMLVGFHEGLTCKLPQAVADRFDPSVDDSWLTGHVASHPTEMMYAVLCMIMGGVLERFEGLRVAFLEANCGWTPYYLWRMDEHYDGRERLVKHRLPLRPSEYFLRQCFVSIEADESVSCPVIDRIENNVVFSTDYPHPDSAFPNSVKTFLELPMPEDTKRHVLWDNPMRMYAMN